MHPSNRGFDLDAARRERQGQPIPIRQGGQDFELPAELPAEVFAPLVDGKLDALFELVGPLIADQDSDEDFDVIGVLSQALIRTPHLPKVLGQAVRDVYAGLFAQPEDWERFAATRPSIPDYLALGKYLFSQYGVGLGEALGLSASSGSDGLTSSPTSPPATSTPAASGSPLGIPS